MAKKNLKEKIDLIILGCLVGIMCVMLVLISVDKESDGIGKEICRYSGVNDIVVTHDVEKKVARITIKDTYTKNGEKYYEITTSVTGDELFTYAESEYDRLFGLENDAFDCEIYSMYMEGDVIEYEGFPFIGTELTLFFPEDLIDYQDNSYKISYSGSVLSGSYGHSLKCEKYSIGNKKCRITGDDYKIETSIEEVRYSFLGQTDFSEEELESYKNELDALNHHILDAFNASREVEGLLTSKKIQSGG